MTETNRGKTKTATEFYHEKFADEKESEPVWVDLKDESDDPNGGISS